MSNNAYVNINKIDFLLKEKFNIVNVSERNEKNGIFFEITAKSNKVNESNHEIKIIIDRQKLERNICEWSYYTNPLNENSLKIDRISNIESFANDALDIVINKRFDQDYITESINEGIINISDIEDKEYSLYETNGETLVVNSSTLSDILENNGIYLSNVELEPMMSGYTNKISDYELKADLSFDLDYSQGYLYKISEQLKGEYTDIPYIIGDKLTITFDISGNNELRSVKIK